MSKLSFTCGHVIVDQAGLLSFKAHLFADQDIDTLFDETAELIAEVAALPPHQRQEWLEARLASQYPAAQPFEEVVADVMASAIFPLTRHLYECECCGTVWIQRSRGDQRFQPYTPAPGNQRGILRSARQADGANGTAPA
ncbi:MAG TPA: hypothetical protein VFS20_04855 [Longimicrobium sp.]|nr:hypothetical protein [Longimicrobium sp.]